MIKQDEPMWTPWKRDVDGLKALIVANQAVIIAAINNRGDRIMAALDDLQAAVTKEDTVIDSAITLLQGLSAALAAAGTDPAKLAALKTDIDNKTQTLADAVSANTPASG